MLDDLISHARRQANAATGLDRFQWLVILAALEATAAQSAGGTSPNHRGYSPTAVGPVRGKPAPHQPQAVQRP